MYSSMYVLVETGTGYNNATTRQFSDLSGIYSWVRGEMNATSDGVDATLLQQIGDMIAKHTSKAKKDCIKGADISDNSAIQELATYFINNFCDIVHDDEPQNGYIDDTAIAHYAFILFLLSPGSEHKVHVTLHNPLSSNIIKEVSGYLGRSKYKLHGTFEHQLVDEFYDKCYHHHNCLSIFHYYKMYDLVYRNIYEEHINKKGGFIGINHAIDAFVSKCIKKEYKSSGSCIKSTLLYNKFIECMCIMYYGSWRPVTSRDTMEELYTHKNFSVIMKMNGFESVRKSDGIYYKGISIVGPLSEIEKSIKGTCNDISNNSNITTTLLNSNKENNKSGSDSNTIIPYNSDTNNIGTYIVNEQECIDINNKCVSTINDLGYTDCSQKG